MKILRRIGFVTILLTLFMLTTAWASELTWDNVPGHHDQSILLSPEVTSSKDSVHQYGRGEYLAEGSVEIINRGNGVIYIVVDTFSYVYADRILHQVFLEYWDEDLEDWVYAGDWEFEVTKEEVNGELFWLSNSLTLTGYETGLYYRVKGLHGVEYNDEFEACATESNGVLITDN